MKKTFAILLLTIFLFNVGGYYVVFWGLRYQSDQQLETVLDQGAYSQDQTLEIKIPITVPYALHPRGFERVNGEFEYEGEYYQLVKQKLENDTLYVVLVRDIQEKNLVETMNDYVGMANDFEGDSEKAMNFLGKLLKDYNTGISIEVFPSTLGNSIALSFKEFSGTLISRTEGIPSPPPKS